MAIDTPEKRRSAIDYAMIRGTGMPIPMGSIPVASRVHVLNLYSGILPMAVTFDFWRQANRLVTTWVSKNVPTDSSIQTE